MDWDDYRLVWIVVRSGSMRAAARELGLDHATVSRRVARCESSIGTKLVLRGARGLTPTQAGMELAAAAEGMDAQAKRAGRRIAAQATEAQGWVRVTVNVNLALYAVMPMLARCAAAHSEIDLDIRVGQALVDLGANDADVAIRVAATPPEDLIAHRVCGFAVAPYAASASFTHWIGWDPDSAWSLFATPERLRGLPVRHRFGDEAIAARAAALGQGAAFLPCLVGDSTDGLVRLADPEIVAQTFVLRHPDHRTTPRVRSVMRFLVEALPEAADLIEGRRPNPS